MRLKRIGIVRVRALETGPGDSSPRSAGDGNALILRLDVFDVKSGVVISSEDINPSPVLKKTISDKRIEDFFLDLPINMLSFRLLNLPFSDKKKLTEVIPFELQGLIMEDIHDIVFDSICLGRDDDNFKILVVYTEKRQFGGLLGSLSDSGIEPSVAGSITVGCMLKERTDPSVITERLVDLVNVNASPPLTSLSDCEKEELLNPTINLRTGDFEFTGKASRLSKILRVTVFLLCAIAVIINLNISTRILKERKDISLIRNEIRRSYSSLFPTEKRITDELYQLKAHLRDARERLDLTGSIPALNLLLNLSSTRPQGIVFYEIGLTTEGLTIKGESASMEEINRFKEGLSDIAISVNVSDLKPVTGGRFNFTISGVIRGSNKSSGVTGGNQG